MSRYSIIFYAALLLSAQLSADNLVITLSDGSTTTDIVPSLTTNSATEAPNGFTPVNMTDPGVSYDVATTNSANIDPEDPELDPILPDLTQVTLLTPPTINPLDFMPNCMIIGVHPEEVSSATSVTPIFNIIAISTSNLIDSCTSMLYVVNMKTYEKFPLTVVSVKTSPFNDSLISNTITVTPEDTLSYAATYKLIHVEMGTLFFFETINADGTTATTDNDISEKMINLDSLPIIAGEDESQWYLRPTPINVTPSFSASHIVKEETEEELSNSVSSLFATKNNPSIIEQIISAKDNIKNTIAENKSEKEEELVSIKDMMDESLASFIERFQNKLTFYSSILRHASLLMIQAMEYSAQMLNNATNKFITANKKPMTHEKNSNNPETEQSIKHL